MDLELIFGLDCLSGIERAGSGHWKNGFSYNPTITCIRPTPLRSRRSGPRCLAKRLIWFEDACSTVPSRLGSDRPAEAGRAALWFRRSSSLKASRVKHNVDSESQYAAVASCCDEKGLLARFQGGGGDVVVVVVDCSSLMAPRCRFRPGDG